MSDAVFVVRFVWSVSGESKVVGKGGLHGRVGVHVERCLPLRLRLRLEGKGFFGRMRTRRDGEHLDR